MLCKMNAKVILRLLIFFAMPNFGYDFFKRKSYSFDTDITCSPQPFSTSLQVFSLLTSPPGGKGPPGGKSPLGGKSHPGGKSHQGCKSHQGGKSHQGSKLQKAIVTREAKFTLIAIVGMQKSNSKYLWDGKSSGAKGKKAKAWEAKVIDPIVQV